eukprot:UN20539
MENSKDVECSDEYLHTLMNSDSKTLCTTCRIVKPLRSKHCSVCGKCVRGFDHHCPWVDNCIGENNYRKFVFHIMIETISIIFYYIGLILFFVEK